MATRPDPAYRGAEPYVFVSYSHEDDARVLPEIAWLQAQGIRVWWDEGITPGAESWRAELASAIRDSAVLLYFVSPRSVASAHCVREVGVALDEFERPVIAVHLEPTTLPDTLVLALSGRQAILQYELTASDYAPKLGAALEEHIAHGRAFVPATSRARNSHNWWTLAAGLVLGVSLALAPRLFDGPDPGAPAGAMTRSYVDLHPDYPLTIGSDSHSWSAVAVSKDGRHLAYIGKDAERVPHVLVSNLTEPGFRRVEGSEGALNAFFSPDGEWVGFFTASRVRKAPVGGGAAMTVEKGRTPIFAEWVAPDDFFIAGFRAGQEVQEVFSWSYTTDVLADAETLLRTETGLMSTAVNQAGITLVSRDGGEHIPLLSPGFGGRYLPGGFLFYAHRGQLHGTRLDLASRAVGVSKRLVTGVAMDALMGQVHASASDTGLLAFAEGGDLSIGRPVWMDRDGEIDPLPLPSAQYNVFSLGPGDANLALQVCDVEDHVVVLNLSDGSSRQLGHTPAGWPVWASDGRSLYLSSNIGNRVRLGRVDLQSESFEILTSVEGAKSASFSHMHPDAGGLAVVWPEGGVHLLSPGGSGLETLIGDGAWGAQFSPDARLIAYVSYDTGASRVRVRSYPDGRFDIPVSAGNNVEPVWCRGCDELYFHDADTVYSVRVVIDSGGLSTTPPEPIWTVPDWVDSLGRSYDVSEDGQRLLYIRREDAAQRSRITLIHNWYEQLETLPQIE